MKLNLGAGAERREGFVSVDLRRDTADVVADARALPAATGSVDAVLATDLLEHFPASETSALLAEWRRVLVPGGRLTVKVPNLAAIAQGVLDQPGWRRGLICNIYGGHRWGPEGAWDTHHTGWTPDLLHEDLTAGGFEVLSNDGALNMTAEAVAA